MVRVFPIAAWGFRADHPASAMCLAIPGKITEIGETDALYRMGRVDFEGVIKDVSLACVPEAAIGDYVLVHVGVALSVIDAADAAQVLADLRHLDEIDARSPPDEALP